MKYCISCGARIPAGASFCPECGAANPKNEEKTVQTYNSADYRAGYSVTEDLPSTGLNVLAFFLPVVGLIMYLIMMESTPNKAKAIGKFALIGFIAGIVFGILSFGCTAMLLFGGF